MLAPRHLPPRWALAALLLGVACAPPGFDDHTVPRLESVARFEALASEDARHPEVKFLVTSFDQRRGQAVLFMDARFYSLHDEWAWFRLLNGQVAPGIPLAPVEGLSFGSVREIYEWAATQRPLPLDLTWTSDGRLYSPTFYRVGLYQRPPSLGLGTLMRLPAREGREEGWVFFLEYDDPVTHEDLSLYFEALRSALPKELFAALRWAVRSPVQEELAQRMEREGLAYSDRIVRMRELSVPGEVEVYAGGLTAGRVRRLSAAELGQRPTGEGDVLVLDAVPDYLPPAAALLTATLQTPLAHVAVLARNRGIPDAYRGGLFDDVELESLSRIEAPVVVHAVPPDRLVVKPITEQQLATWQRLKVKPWTAVPAVDASKLPYVYDLEALSLADVERLRLEVGGKAAGFLALLAGAKGAAPPTPAAVTVRAYVEHLAPLRARLEAMLAHPDFTASARARYLVLEGKKAFDERYPSPEDARFQADFLAAHAAGDALGDWLAQGGVVAALRARPLAPAALAAIRAGLVARFGSYPATQALRFRSSSTVEDIEGFNGAGLYESFTGFLDPAAQPSSSDRSKSIEAALLKTFASYWRAEAFEERRLERIEHLSGAMGAVVHARFDDDAELANGVLVFTLLPPGSGALARLEVNVQLGADSVTNPTGSSLPEVDRVERGLGGALSVARLRPSSAVPAGTYVLPDAALTALFSDVEQVARAWLNEANRKRPAAQAARALVLDLELKEVAAGWPQGSGLPRRLVLKQARSLEPGTRSLSPELTLLPIPRDLLVRARRIERWACQGAELVVRATELYSEPLLPPDEGFSKEPFTGQLEVEFESSLLGRPAGTRIAVDHRSLAQVRHPARPEGTWALEAALAPEVGSREGLSALEVRPDGSWRLEGGGQLAEGTGLACRREVLFSTPQDYLLGLVTP